MAVSAKPIESRNAERCCEIAIRATAAVTFLEVKTDLPTDLAGMLEQFDMSANGPETADGWALFIEASRLAYADRDHYVGDTDFVDVPVEGLLDRDYLARTRR